MVPLRGEVPRGRRLNVQLQWYNNDEAAGCCTHQAASDLHDLDGVDMADESLPEARAVVTRKEAVSSGAKRYFTGKPCCRAHISERIVSSRKCLECPDPPHRPGYHVDWSAQNPGRVASYAAKWRSKNPGHAASYMAAKRETDSEAMLAAERARYAANPEKFAVKGVAYRKANPELIAVYARNRRAIKKQAEGSHTKDEILTMFFKQNGKCANCGTSIRNGYHADHIKPLALGGSNWISNIQLLCAPCNLRKNALDPIEFARREGRLV